ncbi:MAG: glycosyltransferase [Bacteroidota bacterium]
MAASFKYKLSVIIVNYNVEYFLEQCLNSVKKALEKIEGEVFVVDNNSIDGSVDMVQRKFPEYNLIANKENLGFSSANNQGILLSNSEYVLLLNPDTVVEEDTFIKVVEFMDQHKDAGGLGVHMVDGKGNFLPESKRGLPTPSVAFYKIFGLSALFPKSKKFGKYHLGFLDEFENHEVDILSGAFMLMRMETLEKVGLLDETFFMYGEDIDLSYRIQKGGYKNYYFSDTNIIHYKGESTKKSSVNYVFVFYRAMVIFAEKHFSKKNARSFSFLINLAIYFRASLAIGARFIKRITQPIVDFVFIAGGLLCLTNYWDQHSIKFPPEVLKIAIPIYTFTWLLAVLFNGGYDKPIKFIHHLKGIVFGTILILIVYGLLPKDWQFSRLFILLGATWTFFYYLISHLFLHVALGGKFSLKSTTSTRFAVVGTDDEFQRISAILRETRHKVDIIEQVAIDDVKSSTAVGTINQLDQVVHIHQIDEVIFSAKDISAGAIIAWMCSINSDHVDFKIAQPESLFLIGSNSIETAGDLYVLNINNISKRDKIRAKRTFDIFISLSLLLSSPLTLWFYNQKGRFLGNLMKVLVGKNSLVGYHSIIEKKVTLPNIRKGILTPQDEYSVKDESMSEKLNLIYARDYSIRKDFTILLKSWKSLDR